MINLKNWFANPKTMTLAGLLAMVPKGIVTGILAFSLGLFLSNNLFWSLCFVLYPIVGILFDIALYRLKDKLWETLPEPNSIPTTWEISPEQLLQFAKKLPKIRLMRLVGCLLVLPFLSFNERPVFSVIFSWMITGYFIFSLFDWIWLKIFKLKRPEFIIVIKPLAPPRDFSHLDDISKRNARENDTTFPGSSAWFAQKNIDSM